MSNIEDIKRKIEALLAKANDTGATEAEADAFNRKAFELMTRYNIERSEIGAEQPVERTHVELTVQLRPWSQAVLSGLTRLYYCTYFSTKLDAKGRKHRITIVGEKQNALVCHAIAVMVLRSIITEARSLGDGRSFMTGAGYRVFERCREMTAYSQNIPEIASTKQLGHTTGGKALVALAQTEASGNQDYIANVMNIRLAKARASKPKVSSSDAYNRGREHGNKVQLRRNLLGHKD